MSQFPPSTYIVKQLDGSFKYNGYALDVMDFTAKALNVRWMNTKYRF